MAANKLEERILVIAPVGQDATIMADLLQRQGLEALVCTGLDECCRQITHGAGAVLLTDEALELPNVDTWLGSLRTQPPWSELPLIILTREGESRLARLLDLVASAAGNVTLLERPMRTATLWRSIQVALASRRRQYQVRDLIAEQQRKQRELEQAHAALRESEEQFRALAENLPTLAWVANPQGGLVWTNHRWFEYTGTTLEEMQSWGWQHVQHPDHIHRVADGYKRALARGEHWEDTFPLRSKGGEYRWFLSRAFPIHDAQGAIIRWFGISTDITERIIFEGELERQVAERTADLRATNEQLEAFVYSIAHDLRAPLRAITGFSQSLVEDFAATLPPDAEQMLQRIQTSSEFMDKLLLDLLAYGRTARAQLDLGPVEVRQAWESALFQCATQIEQTKARVETLQPLSTVRAHEATLGQILANLLSNALKFMAPEVQPCIRFWAQEQSDSVRLWVEDNGIGIPPSQHERIFRVFERLHGARYAGTGIGLSIVRKGVERMGGKVGLDSAPGTGTRFWIELPKAA